MAVGVWFWRLGNNSLSKYLTTWKGKSLSLCTQDYNWGRAFVYRWPVEGHRAVSSLGLSWTKLLLTLRAAPHLGNCLVSLLDHRTLGDCSTTKVRKFKVAFPAFLKNGATQVVNVISIIQWTHPSPPTKSPGALCHLSFHFFLPSPQHGSAFYYCNLTSSS